MIEATHGHDIRSALFAIDGAARTLADQFGKLADADRIALGRMVGAGVDRLGLLVDVRMEEIQEFGIDTVVQSVVRTERKAGMAVSSAVPAGLRAVGRATDLAVVLHTLIRSPRVRFDGAPVILRGECRDGAVVLLVEPAGLTADSLIESPDRMEPELGPDSGADALDLYVAARLMGEQGGDVWTATHAGGRVSFGVRLPATATPVEGMSILQ
jgi:hypothetical protein